MKGSFLGYLIGATIAVTIILIVFFVFTGGSPIPYSPKHIEIANNLVVTVGGRSCELTHVVTNSERSIPQDITDIVGWALGEGGPYTHSVWFYKQGSNVQVVMEVWGALGNSTDYICEFARLTFEAVAITGYTHNISLEGYEAVVIANP